MEHKTRIRTKVLSLLLSLVMVLSLVPSLGLTAYAATAYSGGTGTQTDPWLISTVDDWKALATAVNGGEAYEGKFFKQTADLDMSNASDIKPVGKMETPFAGNYDGNGFKISNATIQGITDVVYDGMVSLTVAGVFGSVAGGGSISNLVADNLTVNATDAATGFPFNYAGGLIAYAEGCTVENCSVSNSGITATGTQTTFAGGIVGFAASDGNNNITSAFSKCASEKNTVSAGVYAGGVVGAIQNNNNGTLSFTDCYSAKNTVNGEWISAFLGGSQRGNATLTNGFVYDCSAGSKGVFISETTTGKLNVANCYYYDTHELNPNAEGATAKTADEMKSLASALGDTFTDGELYPVFGHKHSFTYSANGATITATCDNADGKCSLTDCKVTLTIGDPANIYANDNSASHEFTLEGLDDFNSATGLQVSADDIVYYKGDYTTNQIRENKVSSSPTYRARLTVNGATAEHSFKYSIKLAPHTHKFTYTADGNVITATCIQSDPSMEACDLTDKQATLTLNAPAHKTYGDGLDANATITGEIPGVTNPTINYRRSDTPLSSAPTDAGTYTAWCQLGNATASVEYTIGKATNNGWTTLPQAINNLVYTGQPQDLITAGVPSAGNALYTVGTDPDNEPDDTAGGRPYTSSVPEMTNAGTYYVWCKIDGGKNYTSIAANKIEVKIEKADITPTVSLEGWTYGEDAKTPSVDGNTGSSTVTYTYKVKDADDSTYSATVPTNAGDYTVKATIAESGNYNGGEATADFTISQKSASITADAKSKTYGDADPELTATVEGTVGSDTLNYTLNRAEGNNFGEYDITVTLGENPNYVITTTGAKFTINKKAVTIKAKDQSIYVGGNVPTLEGADFYTVTGLVGEDTLTTTPTLNYQKDGNAASPVNTTAGTYDIVPSSAAAGDNYEITYQNGTLTISRRPSSGGGGSSAGTTITVPVSGDSASVSVSASVSGTTATVKAPTTAQLNKVIGESVKTGDVTIDVSGLNKDIATVSIPTETVKAIEKAVSDPDNDASALTVKLTDGSVTFDAAALAAIAQQAKGSTIQLNLDSVGESKLKSAQKTAIKDMDVQAVYDAYLTSNGQRISDFKGGKATVTISYTLKDGQTGRGVAVWYVAEDGEKAEVPTTYNNKTVSFTAEHFSNYVIAYDAEHAVACPKDDTCPMSAFTDLNKNSWYHDGVHFALDNGVMSGYGSGKFGPNDLTSRAMIAQILWNMEGKPVVNYAMSYTDVGAGAWYAEAVRWATAQGIMAGYGHNKFGPNDDVTREQLVTIMYRYAQMKKVDVSVGEDTNILSYDDAFDVSEWAIPAMQWAVGAEIVNGTSASTISPKNNASRAEIATIVMRYCEKNAK